MTAPISELNSLCSSHGRIFRMIFLILYIYKHLLKMTGTSYKPVGNYGLWKIPNQKHSFDINIRNGLKVIFQTVSDVQKELNKLIRIWRLAQGSFNFLLFCWPSPGPLALLSSIIWLSYKREFHAKPPQCVQRHRTSRRHLIMLLFKLLTNPLRLSVGALMARDW